MDDAEPSSDDGEPNEGGSDPRRASPDRDARRHAGERQREDAGSHPPGADDPPGRKCDYCRLPIPESPVTAEYEGDTYHFCSDPCRETLLEEDRVFTEYHGGRRFDPGVSALRAGLPQGIPRNSFVLVSGQPGTREEALYGELVWRALERGEPAVVAAFLDTPVSVVQEFVALGWNVLPYLASGQLQLLDCFSYRLDDPDEMVESMSAWNRHLHRVASRSTTRIRDPSNPQAVLNALERCIDGVTDPDAEEGVVLIDSLTEFGSLVQPVQGYDFVKDLRAGVAKARGVPVFAGATRIDSGEEFPHDLGYIADGVIDLALSDEVVEDTLMKRIRVRKMTGVFSIRRWATYEFTEGHGLVAAEPGDAGDDATGETEGTGEPAATTDGDTDDAAGDQPPTGGASGTDPQAGPGSATPTESGGAGGDVTSDDPGADAG